MTSTFTFCCVRCGPTTVPVTHTQLLTCSADGTTQLTHRCGTCGVADTTALEEHQRAAVQHCGVHASTWDLPVELCDPDRHRGPYEDGEFGVALLRLASIWFLDDFLTVSATERSWPTPQEGM